MRISHVFRKQKILKKFSNAGNCLENVDKKIQVKKRPGKGQKLFKKAAQGKVTDGGQLLTPPLSIQQTACVRRKALGVMSICHFLKYV